MTVHVTLSAYALAEMRSTHTMVLRPNGSKAAPLRRLFSSATNMPAEAADRTGVLYSSGRDRISIPGGRI